jgi:Arc/MetJ-type ribon-helix-helix transcriptional regulator
MSDTEKITINLGAVDLGKIDLLVEHGHYSNRTDFIRTAIRSQMEKHTDEVQQVVARQSFVIGVLIYDHVDLEKLKAKGEKIKLSIIGMLSLDKDIPVDLALQVVEEIRVRGIFVASDALKEALAERIK